MSVEENKAAVRRWAEEIWSKGNIAVSDEVLASDVVDHNPMPGQAPGVEGQKQTAAMIRAVFPDMRLTLEALIAEGDKVVDRWTAHGTHQGEFMGIPPTGKAVTITGMDILRLRDGKIVELWHQEDIARHAAANRCHPSAAASAGVSSEKGSATMASTDNKTLVQRFAAAFWGSRHETDKIVR